MSYVEVNGHKLHYADSHPQGAPENGVTLVFIHGLGSSQNFYHPVIPYLTTSNRCITLDTYGSARSEYTGQPISIQSIAQDVLAVMDKFQVFKAVVVGHSMGGLVVMLLGAEHPDRIRGVIAVGPTHPSETLVSVMTKRAETVTKCTSCFPPTFAAQECILISTLQPEWSQWQTRSPTKLPAPAPLTSPKHSSASCSSARTPRATPRCARPSPTRPKSTTPPSRCPSC